MVNHEQGEVEITSGGKTYTLVLKTAGLAALQQRFSPVGKTRSLDDVLKEILEGCRVGSLPHIIAVFWASLQKHHPGTSYEQTINIIDDAGGVTGLESQLAALGLSTTPDPADLEVLNAGRKANPQRAQATRQRGAGVNSTRRRASSAA